MPSMVYKVVTNSVGFRSNYEPDNSLTVIGYGDSYTFGPYLPNQHTWPDLLQNLLRKELKNKGLKPLVFNAGVAGSTIFHELEVLKGTHKLNPDLIILQVLDNDIFGVSVAKMRQMYPVNIKNPKNLFIEMNAEKQAYKQCGL